MGSARALACKGRRRAGPCATRIRIRMILDAPIPFAEALGRLLQQRVMPTTMSSVELRDLAASIRQRSFFSARTPFESLLQDYKKRVTELANGERDIATQRLGIKKTLKEIGYSPDPEERGTIKDLSSDARIDLVLRTNTQAAQGYGQWRQGMDADVLDEFPAQELYRLEVRKEERDWSVRWLAACRAVGDAAAIRAWADTGRMVARKDSPVWQALGAGAGGFDSDALGSPYPQFAFNSGMDIRDVDRADAMTLGLIDRGEQVRPQFQGFEL